ncbi:hypothetical protein GH714_000447 [Hevea brasiliensis]|uniref:Pentacotripeptide-repeat region of PRORP domain-containing protein n=1 Tax=Hevea brasiliensis TaxID=3981 RepID=A0A6A6L988_HEVBR|nr:hypothetical protein GH714_000447 [Hevea brasiliensis]
MIKHGKEPDLFTYNSLLNGLCLRGQTDDALKPFELMVNRGIEVHDVSYNMLINGYRKSRKVNDVSYNMLITGYRKSRKIDEAIWLFQEMQCEGLKPTTLTYNMLIAALFQGGRIRTAKDRTRNGNASIVLASSAVLGFIVEVRPARMMKDEKS